jgi:Abhydrolase family
MRLNFTSQAWLRRLISLLAVATATSCLQAQPLPGTVPLEPNEDFSAAMVAGIDRFALRRIEQSRTSRRPDRERLKAMLGVVDARLPITTLELVGDTSTPALLHETDRSRIYRVRWPVLEGVFGEGLYLQPKGKALARVIYLPDASETPESMVDQWLVASGCEVVIPTLISRDSTYSTNEKFGVKTNIPHREWIYRQSYELGRHIIGYEIQKVLSLVDWFKSQPEQLPTVVAGVGEGGMLAMYSGAIDDRFDAVSVTGYFGPREQVWQEPIYRNVFGLLSDFGDAEIASLIATRPLVIQHRAFPEVRGPPMAQPGERSIAAPGRLWAPSTNESKAEIERANQIVPGTWIHFLQDGQGLRSIVPVALSSDVAQAILNAGGNSNGSIELPVDKTRERRQVRTLEAYTQRLIVECEAEREKRFWQKLPLSLPNEFEAFTAVERERFWNEVIGRLPDPDVPMNAKSRLVKETEHTLIYEVMLDVWQDVFSWGWLCLPKNRKVDEKRPVIVCQHGLEGIPADVFNDDPNSAAYKPYKAFALRLAEQGFITFAPHNPYRGQDRFRTLQRKLNPLGLTLYSVINGQHQRILEWLKSQPFTQPDKIAFYGLSYGGKSAMRTPAVLTDYCLSICSGDFNEWVRKCVTTDKPMSYIHTGEYEIWEWNMGRTFNYAEMAALIAPRPFMVERGHNDGVGIDEWVNYEYAKVRRLYNKLNIGGSTTIEHFDGPHTIHGVGTFEFLKQQLDWN